jgi:hypothetical protein
VSTITAAGHTWHHLQRGNGDGCWHQLDVDEDERCLSLQGLIDEHTAWVQAQPPDSRTSLPWRVLRGLLGVS